MRDAGHEFALYVSGLSNFDYGKSDRYVLQDPQLVHRISRVLRLHPEDLLILFDANMHFVAHIVSIEKKRIVCAIKEVKQNVQIVPHITLWLPLLKREAFEQAIYSAVELGVNDIQFIHTAKEQRHWHGKREFERLHNIMVAAAEQSKNFALPTLHEPQSLDVLLDQSKGAQCIFFDVEGKPLLEVAQGLNKVPHQNYVVFIGPEGDLTEHEKFQLQKMPFLFVHLTPTILRAQQAVAVGVGALRSLLS